MLCNHPLPELNVPLVDLVPPGNGRHGAIAHTDFAMDQNPVGAFVAPKRRRRRRMKGAELAHIFS